MRKYHIYLKQKQFKRWRLLALLILCVIVGWRFSLLITQLHANQTTSSNSFSTQVQTNVFTLQHQLDVYSDALYTGRGIMAIDPSLSRQDWTTFFSAQAIIHRYPAVYGIIYATVIPTDQTSSFTDQLNASRESQEAPFSIFPDTTHTSRAVITYVAPMTANQRAIGYDLYSSPDRLANLLAAAASGTAQASVPLPLLADSKQTPPSIIFSMPVYDPSLGSSATPTQRQQAVTGYVILVLRTHQLLDSIMAGQPSDRKVGLTVSTNHQVIY